MKKTTNKWEYKVGIRGFHKHNIGNNANIAIGVTKCYPQWE